MCSRQRSITDLAQSSTKKDKQQDNEKLYAEIQPEIIEHLALKPGYLIEFSMTNGVSIWVSRNVDIPNEIFQPLIETFKTESKVFHWLNNGQRILSGKAPIELLSKPGGKDQILDLVNRIKLGDFS